MRQNFKLPECPHCGQRMSRRHGVHLPPTSALILDMIEHSRWRGVSLKVLANVFFASAKHPHQTAAVHIVTLNSFLESTGICVRMVPPRTGLYRIVKRRVREVA